MRRKYKDIKRCPKCDTVLYNHGSRNGKRRWICPNNDYSCTENSNRDKLTKMQRTALAFFKGIFENSNINELDLKNIWNIYSIKSIPEKFKIVKHKSGQKFKGSKKYFIVSFIDDETIEIYKG